MADGIIKTFVKSNGDIISPVLAATLFATISEGLVTASFIAVHNGTFGEALLGFVSATFFAMAFSIPSALFLAWLFSLESSRSLGRSFVRGLSGLETGGGAATILSSALVFFTVLVMGGFLGRSLVRVITPFFSSVVLVVFTIALLVLGLFIVAPVCRVLNGWAGKLPGPPEVRAVAAMFAVAGFVLLSVSAITTLSWALMPTAILIGIGLGLHPRVRVFVVEDMALKKKGSIGAGIVLMFTLGSVCSLHLLSEGTKQALLYDAKYVGTLLGVLNSVVDKDKDGFSGLFLGGDCNDSDPFINPRARDIPGNGIDENCTGKDATNYAPPSKPGFEIPAGLKEKNNIVFILVDALRPDHISANGYERATTPNIDEFLKSSLWFQRAYTPAPRTQSAMTSMFTGLDVRQTSHKKSGGNRFVLNSDVSTIAEEFRGKGYDTVGYTISHVIQHKKGLGQGFRIWETPWPTDEWRKAFYRSGKLTTDAAIEYLKNKDPKKDKPYFLFTHYRCTHDPYIKHKEWDYGDKDVDRYDSALSYCDREIGRLLDELDSRADSDSTAVFLYSDHGELFGDHGYSHHGHSLYEADVRIVMSLKVSGIKPQLVTKPVSLSDIAPTALSLAGLKVNKEVESFNLLSYIEPDHIPLRPLFLFTDLRKGRIIRNISGVVSWPFKYIHDRRSKKKELYHLERDPEEEKNLSLKLRKRTAELEELLESFEASLSKPNRPEVKSKHKALGDEL